MELGQNFFLLEIFLSIFRQNLDNVHDFNFFLLSTFHWQYNNIFINYICILMSTVTSDPSSIGQFF